MRPLIAICLVTLCLCNYASAAVKVHLMMSDDDADEIEGDDETRIRTMMPRFDPSKPVVFVTHGFGANRDDPSITLVKAAFNARGVTQVYRAWWEKWASQDYVTAVNHVNEVGATIAKYINRIIEMGGHPDNIILVGHSLGAHIMGSAARQASQKVGRVVGLDPAGPFFESTKFPWAEGLKSGDAKIVEIVHTAGVFSGTDEPIGDVDFYANGGLTQPGCPIIDNCSHLRAYYYYAEAIRNPGSFLGMNCAAWVDFQFHNCRGATLDIGFTNTNPVRGKYFLTTNGQAPFGKGQQGLSG